MAFYSFRLLTPLTPATALQRLRSVTQIAPSISESLRGGLINRKTDKAFFIGQVDRNSFRLRREICYRNSFLPQIRGSINHASSGLGCEVRITMTLHPFAAIFLLVWFAFAGRAAFQLTDFGARGSSLSLVPLGMLAGAIALMFAGFIPEVFIAKRMLTQELEGSSCALYLPDHGS